MSEVLYWFGLAHMAAYGLAGAVFGIGIPLEWAMKRFGVYRDIIRAIGILYSERAARKAPAA